MSDEEKEIRKIDPKETPGRETRKGSEGADSSNVPIRLNPDKCSEDDDE